MELMNTGWERACGGELFMSLSDLGVVVSVQALRFERQNIRDHSGASLSEAECVVVGTARPSLFDCVRVVRQTVTKSLINELEVLEFLVMNSEQKWGYGPVVVPTALQCSTAPPPSVPQDTRAE